MLYFFFKQKTAYGMRISDWSSDLCSSDLILRRDDAFLDHRLEIDDPPPPGFAEQQNRDRIDLPRLDQGQRLEQFVHRAEAAREADQRLRSEEHTSELQSLMRTSYAVFCLKKKK